MSPDDGDGDDPADVEEVVSMYEQDKVGPGDAPAPDTSDEGSTDEQVETTTDGTGDGDTAEEMGRGIPMGMGGSDSGEDEPLIDPGGGDPEQVSGTFYVKYAQEGSVTLHEIETAQICTLIENPGFERHEIVEATLVAQPPMEVSYLVDDLESQYSIAVETSAESPTQQVLDIATEELDNGEAVAIEREGRGEIHILRVEPEETDSTAEELTDDEMTYKNAAKFDPVERVEIRTDETEGVVSIRYLP